MWNNALGSVPGELKQGMKMEIVLWFVKPSMFPTVHRVRVKSELPLHTCNTILHCFQSLSIYKAIKVVLRPAGESGLVSNGVWKDTLFTNGRTKGQFIGSLNNTINLK